MVNYRNQLIIFSKNRACQLNLLLDSIKHNSGLLFDKINILFKADNPEYNDGYLKVIGEYGGVNFLKETDFRRDLIKLIDDNFEVTTLMVDDAVMFKQVLTRKIDIIKPVVEDNIIFSLRLGENCNYSHPANLYYKLAEHETIGEYIIFDYTKQQVGDFRYPLSTDGHIYNTMLIKELLIETNFSNPNTLEANLQRFVFTDLIPNTLKCFIESKLVSIPANLVNDTFRNRHGLIYGVSEKELNDKFLHGEKIDMYSMDFSNINGPHKEIKYGFK